MPREVKVDVPRSRRELIAGVASSVGLGAAGSVTTALPQTLSSWRWRRRVLLVVAPSPFDPRALEQCRIFDAWGHEAIDRDLSLVEVSGSSVTGASDTAAGLRRRYHLEPAVFQVVLIGKDGHVALRSARPIAAAELQRRIDAMPMRRAGER